MAATQLTPEQLDAKIEQLSADIGLTRRFVHGEKDETVLLGDPAIGGAQPTPTPTVRGLVESVKAATTAAIGNTAAEMRQQIREEGNVQITRVQDEATHQVGLASAQADRAATEADRIMNLSIAVDDAPYGHMASGYYNAETGMLTLHVPEGRPGEPGTDGKDGTNGTDGVDGRDGTDGKDGKDGLRGADGRDGNPGAVVEMRTGMFAFEIAGGDLMLFHDGASAPDFSINEAGELIWQPA